MKANQCLSSLVVIMAFALPAIAEDAVEKRIYQTRRIEGQAPVVDGDIDDPVWGTVEWSGDFVQREPTDGIPPSFQTQFKMVYDDHAVYFAFRMFDDPAKLTNQLARRDWFPGDWVEVNIDSYHDHRTAFSFTFSLSGTRGDEFISNDGNNWDSSWNPVWTGASQIDDEGWTAETRIPLSQLRFSGAAEQVWGLQITRRLYRLEERSNWQRIPKDRTGWVSNFGEIQGLRDLKPKRRIELMPYAVTSTARFEPEAGNPFRDGEASEIDGGLDGKVGITNDLTLDFTINPDFGQVEADPSQVNLSAFETFFSEQRPFFIEGRDIFDLRVAPATTGGSFTQDMLFYSRRIGRSPRYSPDTQPGAYVDSPDNTAIIGAFKLSGKTASGLSIGLLESVTQKEEATIDFFGERDKVTVEPLTNYLVGRLQQDYRDGDVQIGGILTAVNRDLEPHLSGLRKEAYAGGLDFSTYFRNRDYRLEAAIFGSQIAGSEEAILAAQTSSARYYQRPDNDAATLDPTRTSLSGHAGSIRLSRTNNHDLRFQTGVAWRSPGFEINDLGFMRSANEINQFTWVGWRKRDPFSIFDRLNINGNQWVNFDYAGNFLSADYNLNANTQFRNKYGAGFSINREGDRTSNTELRGGPASDWPGEWSSSFWVETDRRKQLSGDFGAWTASGDESSRDAHELWFGLLYRPTNALQLRLSGWQNQNNREMQYVTTESFAGDDRYVFASLDQETTALTFRVDYSLTPNLTIQYYGQPFVSTGRYDTFKRITDPRADRYHDRFDEYGADQITNDGSFGLYRIDEDLDGVVDYSFGPPDFDYRDFNSNLVVRWEYTPGSAVFIVWNQTRSNGVIREARNYGDDLNELFSSHPDNVLLVKVSKWFSP